MFQGTFGQCQIFIFVAGDGGDDNAAYGGGEGNGEHINKTFKEKIIVIGTIFVPLNCIVSTVW